MPAQRIPLRYTIEFKYKTVVAFEAARQEGVTRSDFCREHNIHRATLQTWECKLEKLCIAATAPPRDPARRARHLTLENSGRVSQSHEIEDALTIYIKDLRRAGYPVSREAIVRAAGRLMPELVDGKTREASLAWCGRYMARSGFTIRRITHSGRASRANMEVAKLAFVDEIVIYMYSYFLDPHSSLPPKRVIFNMDQTAVFCDTAATTVEVVGSKVILAISSGNESYRCTLALVVAADGRQFPLHFVYRGEPGGTVEEEVRGFADHSSATFFVQTNAWFDERVMLEWISDNWRYVVHEPAVLVLDSLRVHKKDTVQPALADLGTMMFFVPGGCTGIAQPLDVSVMSPSKSYYRKLSTDSAEARKLSASDRRRKIFDHSIAVLRQIKPEVIRNAFHKAGPFIPFGPPFNA